MTPVAANWQPSLARGRCTLNCWPPQHDSQLGHSFVIRAPVVNPGHVPNAAPSLRGMSATNPGGKAQACRQYMPRYSRWDLQQNTWLVSEFIFHIRMCQIVQLLGKGAAA